MTGSKGVPALRRPGSLSPMRSPRFKVHPLLALPGGVPPTVMLKDSFKQFNKKYIYMSEICITGKDKLL